ncbi:MAG: N-acetylmuramoyl-L-alanine amidase [Bdellovibrionales bacterium]
MRFGLVIFLIFFCISAFAAPLRVTIDAGHGGTDTGAKRGNLQESELVLLVAFELHRLLAADSRFTPIMTRTTDRIVALEERTKFAEKSKSDVFVSIHANSAPDKKIHGAEIYFQNQLPPDQESLYLAARENEGAIQTRNKEKSEVLSIVEDLERHHQTLFSFNLAKALEKSWPRRKNSRVHVRQAPFHVLTEVDMPSVLVETGYLTNGEEALWLHQKSTQKQIAKSIHNGLIQFKTKWDQTPKGIN